jgi:hypothetical protein
VKGRRLVIESMATIICRTCTVPKDKDEFYLKDRTSGRRSTQCKECQVSGQRYQLLGLSTEQYEALLAAQRGACAICKVSLEEYASRSRFGAFQVDHDHATGRVRGLLCHNCNRAIGMLGDNAAILQRAISYLRSSGVATRFGVRIQVPEERHRIARKVSQADAPSGACCLYCGRSIPRKGMWQRQKYCDQTCRRAAKAVADPERSCEHCDARLPKEHALRGGRFCDRECEAAFRKAESRGAVLRGLRSYYEEHGQLPPKRIVHQPALRGVVPAAPTVLRAFNTDSWPIAMAAAARELDIAYPPRRDRSKANGATTAEQRRPRRVVRGTGDRR